MHNFAAKFALLDRVHIDDDKSISAVVIAVAFYTNGVLYQLGWMHCGDSKEAWISEKRLELIDA